eukprot:scaffold38857_cov37-Prasinocladus_malaysianus.AAC.1
MDRRTCAEHSKNVRNARSSDYFDAVALNQMVQYLIKRMAMSTFRLLYGYNNIRKYDSFCPSDPVLICTHPSTSPHLHVLSPHLILLAHSATCGLFTLPNIEYR